MRRNDYFLIGLLSVRNALADFTWTTTCTETAWQTKEAETMWSTEYSTTTCWSTEPASTVTVYDTTTIEKDYTTIEYSTEISTITIPYTTTATIEYTTTNTVESEVTATEVETQTVYKSYESDVSFTATATAIVTSISTVTVVSLGSTVIIPGKGYTSTVLVENIKTITQACSSTPSLTGLVVCPRLTTNTAYSPPTPLPNNYLWGCPPGELCSPPQIDCNFAADLPGPDYICSPEDCIPTEPVPADLGGPYDADWNSTCPWYETFDSYYNLPPALFGLNYNMFAVSSLGIAAVDCPPPTPVPAPPPSTTTTTSVPPPPPPPPPPPTPTTTTTGVPLPPPTTTTTVPTTSLTTEWLPWTPSSETSATWSPVAPVSSSTSWAEWVYSSSAATAYSSASTWADWQAASSHGPYAPGITAPPRLLARDSFKCPALCYHYCNYAANIGQEFGLNSASICAQNCPFSAAYDQCQTCIGANKNDQPTAVQTLITDLNTFINYCQSIKAPSPTPAAASGTPLTTTSKSPNPPSTPSTSTPPSPSPTTSSSLKSPTTVSSTTSPTSVTVPTSPSTTIVSTTPLTTVCAVSQISDGQPQATDCTVSVASNSPSIASYTHSGAGLQPIHGPAAIMIVGVVVVMAMA